MAMAKKKVVSELEGKILKVTWEDVVHLGGCRPLGGRHYHKGG